MELKESNHIGINIKRYGTKSNFLDLNPEPMQNPMARNISPNSLGTFHLPQVPLNIRQFLRPKREPKVKRGSKK